MRRGKRKEVVGVVLLIDTAAGQVQPLLVNIVWALDGIYLFRAWVQSSIYMMLRVCMTKAPYTRCT